MHTTSETLLSRLQKRPQDEDWNRFVKLYTPLLFYWAKKAGLDGNAAEDLVQELFLKLMTSLPSFKHQGQGSFRGWLQTVAKNKYREHFRREQAKIAATSGSGALSGLADPEVHDQFWEIEYQHQIFMRALELMRADFEEKTWRACWLRVVEDLPASAVAAELNLTEGAVFVYTSRVLRRLREELGEFLD